MDKKKILPLSAIVFLLLFCLVAFSSLQPDKDKLFVSYEVDLQKQDFKLYWKDDKGAIFSSIENLKIWLDAKGEKLIFAMNAGMFKPDHSPQGLFIQDYRMLTGLDTTSGRGNFYLRPNGVFYTTTGQEVVIYMTLPATSSMRAAETPCTWIVPFRAPTCRKRTGSRRTGFLASSSA